MTPFRPLDGRDPDKLGVYRLTGLIGDGGMGRVYAGRSPAGRLVAVKVIRPDLAGDEQFRRRFRSEVERVRQVPAFATAEVLDADPDHDPPYLVFEYVDGPSLGAVVATDGPLSAGNLRAVAIGLAAALRAIHDAGVIHRDLKPDNVLLARGSPKVIDFGIARPITDPRPLTRDNNVLGAIAYLAPERFGRGEVTAAADIFAWGAVVAYAGTGHVAFPGATTGEVLTRIARGEPDLDGLVGSLRSLVRQALAPDPAHRPAARRLVELLTTDRSELAAAESFHLGYADSTLGSPPLPEAQRPVAARPRQVPLPPATFVGRSVALAAVSAALTDGAACVITGAGGVGKTWLALRWAHDAADDFADGQLFVNLRGFDPAAAPLPPGTALAGFLASLGVPAEAMPADVDAQAALFRSLTADRRMLVVLDNARDSVQVLPLLPAVARCRVLITSRHRLAGLVTTAGAGQLALGMLDEPASREVLDRLLGPGRTAAEPAATAAIVRHCAGLPLALGIVAARGGAEPQSTLAALAGDLEAESDRLDALDAGEGGADLRAVFAASYRALPDAAASVFRRLGPAPTPDLGLRAVAALTGRPAAETRRALRVLTGAHLVAEPVPGRFRMHDLVRLYAIEQAVRLDDEDDRRAALRRLVDFALHSAYPRDRLLYAHRPPLALAAPVPGSAPDPAGDRAEAMAWFAAELPLILAVQERAADQGWDTAVWQLAWSMTIYGWRRGNLSQNRSAWLAGLAAAIRLGEPAAESQAHRYLGHAYGQAGELDDALRELRLGLAMSEQIGDLFGQAHCHQLLAWVQEMDGDLEAALGHTREALRLTEVIGHPVWTAIALEAVGWQEARLGDYAEASRHCARALDLHRRHGHREGVTDALHCLGYIARRTGRPASALEAYGEALRLSRESGDDYIEATVLQGIGETYAESRRPEQARATLGAALRIYEAQHRLHRAATVRETLAAIDAEN